MPRRGKGSGAAVLAFPGAAKKGTMLFSSRSGKFTTIWEHERVVGDSALGGLDLRRPCDLAGLFGTALRTSLQVRRLLRSVASSGRLQAGLLRRVSLALVARLGDKTTVGLDGLCACQIKV